MRRVFVFYLLLIYSICSYSQTITTSPISGSPFCAGVTFNIHYEITGAFVNGNVFIAQLSNNAGNFGLATNIGSITATTSGNILATMPISTPVGSAYRIRVVSSNPSMIIGADNGTDLLVSEPIGNPSIFGATAWNAYIYDGTDFPITNNIFLGTYTENNLSFDTKNRWGIAGPSTADASSGDAYQGCSTEGTNFSISFKRTNFTCGYYRFNIPLQDDRLTLFINGIQVFQNNSYTGILQNNIWKGFLNSSSTVEFQLINFIDIGQLQVDFDVADNPLTTNDPFVCSTASILLTVSSDLSLTYLWSPIDDMVPADGIGASVVVPASSNMTYTVTGNDSGTGCTVSRDVAVTIIPSIAIPTPAISNVTPSICSGVTASTLIASGANTYTWLPTTGLNTSVGNIVIANPLTTTTYTVTGNTGCQDGTSTATVTVQPMPASPSSIFGDGTWNAYCYNNTTRTNYYGYYTEDNLNFKTSDRFDVNGGPTGANSLSGLAYTGCIFGNTDYAISFKRTNFTCGYYQIDIPYQDDAVTLLIDGVQVFQNGNYTPIVQTNVWTGFLGPATTIEIQVLNYLFSGQFEISINPSTSIPQTVNSNLNLCVGNNINLWATSSIVGSTYKWSIVDPSASFSFLPSSTIANPLLQSTGATPTADYLVTNELTDALSTGCKSLTTFTVAVSIAANTTISPTNSTSILTACTNFGVTLTAAGAGTYSWSPSLGLSATTGFSVLAKPLVTTTYTVTGSTNCSSNSASATVFVSPLPEENTYPTTTWNVYGFNSTMIGMNYQGYYAESGSGTTGLDFDTRARWLSTDVPSNSNSLNGLRWQGCTINTTNTSLSFKRTGFTCGVYQFDVPSHADGFMLLVNGVLVAQHSDCCDSHINLWTSILDSNSTVEWQLIRNSSESYLEVNFTKIAQPFDQTLWLGGISNDWFNVSNWCNGIPTEDTDVLIRSEGVRNMPVINSADGLTKNITISPFIPGGAYTNSIAAASLTVNNQLNVFGNWTNNGVFNSNTGAINFVGLGSGNTISSSTSEIFNNIIVNKANGISIVSGEQQIKGNIILNNGIVKQNSTLIITNTGSVSGVTNASYIDGVITKVGNSEFTFPIGKAGLYRPIMISAPASVNDSYSAQYFNTNPDVSYPVVQRATILDDISDVEYWMLNKNAGSSNVSVGLSWGNNSQAVSEISLRGVAAWDGLIWTDQGRSMVNGSLASGTLFTSVPSTVYGPFALAEYKLPVGLLEAPDNANPFFYPNPADNTTTIELDGTKFNSLSISNNLGQAMSVDYNVRATKIDINTSTLAAGLYIVNICIDQKFVNIKVVVQR